jgi:hypothetical protein
MKSVMKMRAFCSSAQITVLKFAGMSRLTGNGRPPDKVVVIAVPMRKTAISINIATTPSRQLLLLGRRLLCHHYHLTWCWSCMHIEPILGLLGDQYIDWLIIAEFILNGEIPWANTSALGCRHVVAPHSARADIQCRHAVRADFAPPNKCPRVFCVVKLAFRDDWAGNTWRIWRRKAWPAGCQTYACYDAKGHQSSLHNRHVPSTFK